MKNVLPVIVVRPKILNIHRQNVTSRIIALKSLQSNHHDAAGDINRQNQEMLDGIYKPYKMPCRP